MLFIFFQLEVQIFLLFSFEILKEFLFGLLQIRVKLDFTGLFSKLFPVFNMVIFEREVLGYFLKHFHFVQRGEDEMIELLIGIFLDGFMDKYFLPVLYSFLDF